MSGPVQEIHAAPRQKSMKWRRRWLLAGVLVLLPATMAGVWFVMPQARPAIAGYTAKVWNAASAARVAQTSRLAGEPAMAKQDTVRGVRVMTVRLTQQHAEKRFTGVVAARYETQVGFRVGGKIAVRQVEVGQNVRRGDVLMVLDDADYAAALRAAEANLAAANAQKMQALAEEARQAQLLRQGWTTRAVFDRVVAAARSAEEQVKAGREQVELARNTLGYARLTATDDGIVTAVRAEAGQVVPQGQPVLTLVRPGEREAVIAVPEGQIGDLSSWTAQASFWSRGDVTEPAALREISPQADAASRTHAARFSLPRGAASTELGATVTLILQRKTGEPAATLPTSAVFFKNSRPMVWRLMPSRDRLEAVPLSIIALGAQRSIVAGLMEGDRIVTLGVHRLDEGHLVRAVEEMASLVPMVAVASALPRSKVAALRPKTGAQADAMGMGN
jgi:membrane fusion protein, multidrug efflux system